MIQWASGWLLNRIGQPARASLRHLISATSASVVVQQSTHNGQPEEDSSSMLMPWQGGGCRADLTDVTLPPVIGAAGEVGPEPRDLPRRADDCGSVICLSRRGDPSFPGGVKQKKRLLIH